MADEKKPIELTDDELDNAAGGVALPLSEARRLSDKRVNSSQDLLSDEKKAILGAGAIADVHAQACLASPDLCEVLAVCDRNPGPDKWRDASYPLKERYAALQSPKGRPTGEQFLYDSRCRGVFWAVGHMVSVYLKMLFPKRNRAN